MITGIQSSNRRSGRIAGFSLIEILVVLVVLLIGILAVLRLFPGGFLTIQRTNERTNASALATQQLDAMKNLYSVPESIIAMLPDATGTLIPQLDVPPDDLTDFPTGPFGSDPYYVSNINRIRWVIGEGFRVPIATPNPATGAYGATYILQMGPVFNHFDTVNGAPKDSLDVRGATMERIEQSSVATQEQPDPTPNVSNEGQYAIDYEHRRIAFFPRAATNPVRPAPLNERVFTLRYDYYASENGGVVLKSVLVGAKIRVPDAPLGAPDEPLRPVWQPIFNDPNDPDNASHPLLPLGAAPPANINYNAGLGIVRDSEDVSRAFRLLSTTTVSPTLTAPNWTDDPFEYVWLSPQIGTTDVNVGVLLFNPRGHDTNIETSSGTQPFSARVDYVIYDNHIIREDRAVPNAGPYAIRLSLPFVLENGDVLNDQTAYNGMFRGSMAAAAASPDLLIYNANTGEEIARLENGVATQWAGNPAFELTARAGIIRFAPKFIEDKALRSASLRVYYRSQKEWGMQVQKAHARYIKADIPTQDAQPGRASMTYRSFYVGGSSNGIGIPTRIYFPITEAGKTVVLGRYYVRDINSQTLTFSNEAHQINDNPALFQSFGHSALQLTWIDVKSQHPEAQSLTDSETGLAVENIYGASLKSRVVWRSSGRWRKLDNETILTQPSAR